MAAFMAGVLLLAGCALRREAAAPAVTDVQDGRQEDVTAAPVYAPGYDSVDTATVICYNLEEKTISLRNLETGRQYTLSYDGTDRKSVV